MPEHVRRSFRALLFLCAFVLLCLLVGRPAQAAPEPAADPTLDAAVAVLCQEAAQLTLAGYPQRAVTLIEQFPTPSPAAAAGPVATSCGVERAAALSARGRAERLVLLAPQRSDGPASKYEDPGVPTRCTSDLPAELFSAWSCDRENQAVTTRIAALEPSAPSEQVGQRWSTWFDETLKPLKSVGLAFLVWVALSVSLVQVLPNLLRNRGVAWAVESDPKRHLRWAGPAFVVTGAVLGTIGITGVQLLPTWGLLAAAGAALFLALLLFFATADHFAGLAAGIAGVLVVIAIAVWLGSLMGVAAAVLFFPALVLTVIGILATDVARRSSRRLRVTVDDKSTGDKAVADLRAMICEIGASGPRGIELPRGPDADPLTDVDLEAIASGTWAKLASVVLAAFKPYAPWSLRVETVSDTKLVFNLERNHTFLDAGVFDVASLDSHTSNEYEKEKEKDGKDAGSRLDPMAAPAAFATVALAVAHGEPEGLGGARIWRSVALQYLASMRPDTSDETSRQLLVRAVGADPKNRFAVFSHLLASYRHSADADELAFLLRSIELLLVETGRAEGDCSALGLRLRHAWLVTRVNQVFAVGEKERIATTGLRKEFIRLWKDCSELGARPTATSFALARLMQPVLAQLRASIYTVDEDDSFQLPVASDVWPEGPAALYSQACGLMPLNGPPADAQAKEAVRLLALAEALPTYRDARSTDPQLSRLRTTTVYRQKFGTKVENDFLTIEPFASYLPTLRSLGLEDAPALDAVDPEVLIANYVPPAVVARMKGLAELGCAVTGTLEAWRVPVVTFLVSDGVLRVEDLSDALAAPLHSSLEELQTSPSLAEVQNWLENAQLGSVADVVVALGSSVLARLRNGHRGSPEPI